MHEPSEAGDNQAVQREEWESAVFTLIGHAEGLHMEGKREMPAWFYELAAKIARTHLGSVQALRVQQLGAERIAKYAATS